jgi:hypothetical protein
MALKGLTYSDAANRTISAVRDGVHFIFLYAETDYDAIVAERLTIAAYTPPAITWADIRSKRDGLLAETDWWAVSDRAMSAARRHTRQACVTYRRLSQAQQT